MDNTNNSGNMPQGKKILGVIIAIAVLAIVVMGIVALTSKNKSATTTGNKATNAQANKPPAQTVVSEVKPSSAPEFFPKDLPSEPGATVVKNYNTATPDGRKLGTRVYVTAKTIDANYTIFESYFKKAGWEVSMGPEIKGVSSKTIIAMKPNMQVQVTIGDDQVAKATTVAIIITDSSAKK